MWNNVPAIVRILLHASCLIIAWPDSVIWPAMIESDEIQLSIDESTSLVDVYQIRPRAILAHQLGLGSVLLPGATRPIEISKANIPLMRFEPKGKSRIDIVLPFSGFRKRFYLAFLTERNKLFIAFDSKPVEDVWTDLENFRPGEETLDLLKAPSDFVKLNLFPDLITLRKAERGHLVVPYQEGTLIDFSHLLEGRDFDLFQNNGLTMPFWGVSTPQHSEICIVNYLYTHLSYQAENERLVLRPRFFHDPHRIPIMMQVQFLGKNKDYIDVAKAYRRYLEDGRQLPSLAEKLRRKPQLIHLLEGANVKFPIYMRHERRPDSQGVTPPPRVHDYQSFEDVVDVLADMKTHGVDRLMAVWWGWGKEGYDRLHPDLLPPNPNLGGAHVFTDMNRKIARLGFSIGFHDNYTDIYENAPSFESGSHCLVAPDGQNRRGGFWAGGWCWLLCSTEGLQFAARNFRAMESLGPINACFIDVLTAAPVFDCYSRSHPHTKWGDMKNKRAMMELAAKHFGVMGSEHGFSWGADLCDYFEGITFDPHSRNEWFRGFGTSVPLFAAVYHDGIVQYMHQGAPVHRSAPDRLLFNLRAGGSSYYRVVRREYENPEWKDYFLRAYTVSSDVIRRTWRSPLISHVFLTEGKSVEKCSYGERTIIVINHSPTEYWGTIDRDLLGRRAEGTEIVLAPHGFLVSTPDYAALHGSQWGDMRLERSGWYTFQTQDGSPLREATEIQVMNYDNEVMVNNDRNVRLPKGLSSVPMRKLLGKW